MQIQERKENVNHLHVEKCKGFMEWLGRLLHNVQAIASFCF